jgi:DNA-binding GntR family transcriptional regulator
LSAQRQKIERVALLDQVYEVLKGRILDRAYQPGARLSIDALARELNVSSTPIREALGRLSAEGLVAAEPFVGFSVAPIPSHKYYLDLFAFRMVIEPWAAAETARRRPQDVIATLEATLRAMAEEPFDANYQHHRGFLEADSGFHIAVMAGTDNQPAIRSFRDLRIHLHMSRLFIHREQDAAATRMQHVAILQAIRAGDPALAAEEMRRHLLLSRQLLLE